MHRSSRDKVDFFAASPCDHGFGGGDLIIGSGRRGFYVDDVISALIVRPAQFLGTAFGRPVRPCPRLSAPDARSALGHPTAVATASIRPPLATSMTRRDTSVPLGLGRSSCCRIFAVRRKKRLYYLLRRNGTWHGCKKF